MKTYARFFKYLAEFFFESEDLETKVVDKNKIKILRMFSNFFPKITLFMRIFGKI
jgi:hypothetical protein